MEPGRVGSVGVLMGSRVTGTVPASPPPPALATIQLEDGTDLLLEDGTELLLE